MDEEAMERALIRWRNMAWCFIDSVSEENELLARNDIMQIGLVLQHRASDKLQEMDEYEGGKDMESHGPLYFWAYSAIRRLWQEECDVGHGLIETLDKGKLSA